MAQSFINHVGGPIGLRNNNPGNLRDTGITWEGKIGANGGFVVFDDVAWGIRAFATNLYSSIKKYGTNTLRKYITRYAPPNENDTEWYIQTVSQKTGIGPDDVISNDVDTLRSILRAQFDVEIGPQYSALITDEDIDEGLSRLASPAASFFSAVGVFYKSNKKAINYGTIGLILLGIAGYVYYLKKKKIV
jgi:hypothetical protein